MSLRRATGNGVKAVKRRERIYDRSSDKTLVQYTLSGDGLPVVVIVACRFAEF